MTSLMPSRLTQEERDEVVVILRCSADCQPRGNTPIGLLWATERLGISDNSRPSILAWAMRTRANLTLRGGGPLEGEDYRWVLLEAAQRVEDGTWP